MDAKTYTIREHFLRFERIPDEAKAIAAWKAYVEAHGWTVVGTPKVRSDGRPAVLGRLIETDETLPYVIDAPDSWGALRVPTKDHSPGYTL